MNEATRLRRRPMMIESEDHSGEGTRRCSHVSTLRPTQPAKVPVVPPEPSGSCGFSPASISDTATAKEVAKAPAPKKADLGHILLGQSELLCTHTESRSPADTLSAHSRPPLFCADASGEAQSSCPPEFSARKDPTTGTRMETKRLDWEQTWNKMWNRHGAPYCFLRERHSRRPSPRSR